MITDFKIGARVKITPASLKIIQNSNRSIHAYPSDSFVAMAKANVGIIGTVTHRFPPGYEMTVTLDNGQSFHMKDNWVEKVTYRTRYAVKYSPACHGTVAIIPKGTPAIVASNLPLEDGNLRFWAEPWPELSRNPVGESWQRNYGFLLEHYEVEEVENN